jgi:hypothetical protein
MLVTPVSKFDLGKIFEPPRQRADLDAIVEA